MTTLAELRTAVSRTLRDPDGKTFDSTAIADFVNEGIAQVSRIAPQRFTDDIQIVEDQYVYQPNSADATPIPEIEVVRCELFDTTDVPERFVQIVPPASAEYEQSSATGWYVWGGNLYLPQWYLDGLTAATSLLRVFGYAPYDRLLADDQVTDLTDELEFAVREWARIAGMRRLIASRSLFEQWQTRSNNTDVSYASLNSGLAEAEDNWHRYKRELMVLRSQTG